LGWSELRPALLLVGGDGLFRDRVEQFDS